MAAKANKKAFISDFDGTLVNTDILDIICGIVGKEEESRRLNDEFMSGKRPGLGALIDRINLLSGVSTKQIADKLKENDFLNEGAEDLFEYLRKNDYITILYSGNLEVILQYYQEKLGIDYVVGTKPVMNRGVIESISEENFSGKGFKLKSVKRILKEVGVIPENVTAIGDSLADRQIFDFAGKSISINPKGGIEEFADFRVDDLTEVQDLLE